MKYASHVERPATSYPGVTLVIARLSFNRRLELAKQIRQLAGRHEFLRAGKSPEERMEGDIVAAELESLYVRWGLKEVRGLEIDGEIATPEQLLDCGPEALVREAAEAIIAECGLSVDERKN